MTKTQLKAIKADIDGMWRDRKAEVDAMQDQANNPQVSLMIKKNLGYMMALEDVVSLMYKKRVF